MEINVSGFAQQKVDPDQIELNFTFKNLQTLKDNALKNGTKTVQLFLNELTKLGFKKEDLITKSVVLREEFDYSNGKRTPVGFSYNQNATLKFDLNLELLSTLVNLSIKFEGVTCNAIFTLKNQTSYENKLFELAYLDAKQKAQTISKISGKVLDDCLKISTQPLTGEPVLYGTDRLAKASFASTAPSLEQILTPEKITLTKELFTLWHAK